MYLENISPKDIEKSISQLVCPENMDADLNILNVAYL
jgi:hypothetical protein